MRGSTDNVITKIEISDSQRENFWNNVDVRGLDDCWTWREGKNADMYPSFSIGNRKTMGAHKFSYLMHYGELPKGHYVCHTCDNRRCVNPNHLFSATQQGNVDDMVRKGKTFKGWKRNGPRGQFIKP